MIHKYPIFPDRIRTIPSKFNWLDHRLVRDRHLEHLTPEAAALYLFLVTVSDSQGLSYYAHSSIGQRLSMDDSALTAARHCLQSADLIAYKSPLYQVLDLGTPARKELRPVAARATGPSTAMSLGAILKQITGGTP